MADTITMLNGIRYATSADTDVWTVDGEGSTYQAVKSQYVAIPDEIETCRVIFNNNYDTSASRVHVKCRMIGEEQRYPPKYKEVLCLQWTAIAAQGISTTGNIDVSKLKSVGLHIDCALSSTTAHDGTEIIVQIQKEAGVDSWTDYQTVYGPSGTATKSDCSGVTAAGQTVVGVTNPATGHLNHVGKRIFFEDTVTIAQCQIGYLIAQSGD